MNPYSVVKDFESALCEYTGAKYAVTTTSCTMALLLACKWHKHLVKNPSNLAITIPSRTYLSVPQSIIHAGYKVRFENIEWSGAYYLAPTNIVDSARRFTSGMYRPGEYRCCSFHWTKTLSIGQGGCILHDNDDADEYFRRMRFDGRTEGVSSTYDDIKEIGFHAYMSPRDAAEGLSRLAILPRHNDPLPNDPYPDLSKMEVFK